MRLFREMLASPKVPLKKSTKLPIIHVRNAATANEFTSESSAVN